MPKMEPGEAALHAGHRKRLCDRVELYGLESLEEHEALEYLLYFTNARKDTNPIAHRLIARFGSFSGVIESTVDELCQIEGVGVATARLLHSLPELSRYYECSRVKKAGRLDTTEGRAAYLVPQFRNLRQERLLMLALDDKYSLLRTIFLESGGVSAVNVGMHKVATEAIKSGASYIVLAHNHPGGIALPSRDDITATGEMVRALGLLGIPLIEHIIVAGEEFFSMRDEGRMPFFDPKTGELFYCSKM